MPFRWRGWRDFGTGALVVRRHARTYDFASPLVQAALPGNVPLHVELREDLTRYKLLWDPVALRFTNLDDVKAFLKREYRKGWRV